MKCLIICGGALIPFTGLDPIIRQADKIACADAGAGHARALGITPDVIIGDLDSITASDLAFFRKQGTAFVKYPEKKDQTDSALCADWAINQGATELTFLGASGSRLDHTLANILMLFPLLKKTVRASLVDAHNQVFAVDRFLELEGTEGETISILPVQGPARGVTLSGLEYPLENGVLELGTSLGISNRFSGNRARIRLKEGLLLVIRARD